MATQTNVWSWNGQPTLRDISGDTGKLNIGRLMFHCFYLL